MEVYTLNFGFEYSFEEPMIEDIKGQNEDQG